MPSSFSAALDGRPRLSVVVPVFDERDNVDPLLAELAEVLPGIEPSFEVVVVDDGSRDGTAERLDRALAEGTLDGRLRIVRLSRNAGQSAAFAAGFDAARGALVATMDGDLQIDPRDLRPMLERLASGDVAFVYGRRARRADGALKLLSTRIANAVRNALTGERVADTGCPLKVFRREVLDGMTLFVGAHRFFVTLAHLRGFRSAEVVVAHRPRRSGRSKYGVWNRVFRAWRDCLGVRWLQSRAIRYEARELRADGRVAEGPAAARRGARSAEGASL
jgi:dolichol-phosphate mannosyltransferase